MRPMLFPALAALVLGSAPALAQNAQSGPVVTDGPDDAALDAAPAPEAELIRPAGDLTPETFRWLKRPVVVFADNPADPRFVQQMQYLTERQDALADRDVVVLTDTDPAARSPFRQAMRPRGFMLVVLAKDGSTVLRKPAPWSVRELGRSIDKLPLRQQEIRDRMGTLRE